MSSLSFYAANEDFVPIIEFVLKAGFTVYEQSSRDRGLRTYKTVDEVYEDYSRVTVNRVLYLTLYHPSMGGQVGIERTELNPGLEHTFRYDVEVWGLMQLHCGTVHDECIEPSYTAHNTKKRAQLWADTITRLGGYEDWDWMQTEKLSRALRYHIRKLAVSKHGSRPILPRAARLHTKSKFKMLEI